MAARGVQDHERPSLLPQHADHVAHRGAKRPPSGGGLPADDVPTTHHVLDDLLRDHVAPGLRRVVADRLGLADLLREPRSRAHCTPTMRASPFPPSTTHTRSPSPNDRSITEVASTYCPPS